MPKSHWSSPYQILGFALVLLGVVAVVFEYYMWGSFATVAGAGFVRKAWSIHAPSGTPRQEPGLTPIQGPRRGRWIAFGVIVLFWVLSAFAFYFDYRRGFEQSWPVRAFGMFTLAVIVGGTLNALNPRQ